jgi:hypothetical protein
MIKIKKLLTILIIFVSTTGFFFKPILERCADKKIVSLEEFNRTAEYRSERKPEAEVRKIEKKRKELYRKCAQSKRMEENRMKLSRECVDLNAFGIEYSTYNLIKIRDIKPEENQKKYRNFIKQSLKKKIELSDYENIYSVCIKEQEFNPKLFDAKY